MFRKKDYKAEFKHQEFFRVGYIKDRFPRVEMVTLELNYSDPDNLAAPSLKECKLIPEHPAFFKYDCPFIECIDGGHDLTQPISDMLNNDQAERSGKISCQGWQDSNRINKNRCLCELTFKVTATYKDKK